MVGGGRGGIILLEPFPNLFGTIISLLMPSGQSCHLGINMQPYMKFISRFANSDDDEKL